jgi:cobalt-zinc-cadmium efflux system protein
LDLTRIYGQIQIQYSPSVDNQLQACIAGHFDVEHSTFQLEAAAHANHEPGTY